MTPLHQAMALGWLTASLVAGAGLIARRRWKLSLFFAAYIGLGLVTTPMYLFWPEQFFHQWFCLIVQAGLDVLKLGMAIEVACRTFRVFPGARRAALLFALSLVAGTALGASAVPLGADAWEWEAVVGQFLPRIAAGTIWLMAAVLVLAAWYRVPVHPYHVVLLTSFVAYLGISGITSRLSVTATGAFVANAYGFAVVDMAAELLLRGYWAVATWRPDDAAALAHGETVRRVESAGAMRWSAS